MKTDQFSTSASGADDASSTITLDTAALAAVHGGLFMPPGGGGGAPPSLHLGGIANLGKVDPQPARCKGWKTWNSPQALGVLEGGGLTRVPLLSCPGIKQAATPKVTLTRH
ncbi:MAG TPA: hypothetical protein VHW23_44960 [Kofleriaceae bacterium]|jgi:hypothetical protein|nr:hypothetical protein [Kofleriaceae bacterium]